MRKICSAPLNPQREKRVTFGLPSLIIWDKRRVRRRTDPWSIPRVVTLVKQRNVSSDGKTGRQDGVSGAHLVDGVCVCVGVKLSGERFRLMQTMRRHECLSHTKQGGGRGQGHCWDGPFIYPAKTNMSFCFVTSLLLLYPPLILYFSLSSQLKRPAVFKMLEASIGGLCPHKAS